jgi:hypothetical protein
VGWDGDEQGTAERKRSALAQEQPVDSIVRALHFTYQIRHISYSALRSSPVNQLAHMKLVTNHTTHCLHTILDSSHCRVPRHTKEHGEKLPSTAQATALADTA